MPDPTESVRRSRIAEINSEPGCRAALEAEYGQVWDSDEFRKEFAAISFLSPMVAVRRRADGSKGSFEFQHDPRFYFNFQPHRS